MALSKPGRRQKDSGLLSTPIRDNAKVTLFPFTKKLPCVGAWSGLRNLFHTRIISWLFQQQLGPEGMDSLPPLQPEGSIIRKANQGTNPPMKVPNGCFHSYLQPSKLPSQKSPFWADRCFRNIQRKWDVILPGSINILFSYQVYLMLFKFYHEKFLSRKMDITSPERHQHGKKRASHQFCQSPFVLFCLLVFEYFQTNPSSVYFCYQVY